MGGPVGAEVRGQRLRKQEARKGQGEKSEREEMRTTGIWRNAPPFAERAGVQRAGRETLGARARVSYLERVYELLEINLANDQTSESGWTSAHARKQGG